jgi:glycosyltransferase involved in cell wall biosynthesis
MEISVIIPTFNEELIIKKTLDALSRLVNVSEVVIVDGGSTDKTIEIVEAHTGLKKLKLIKTGEANRGKQFHEGTLHAAGDIFWFVHADTRPMQGCGAKIKSVMKYSKVAGGNFEILFDGDTRWAHFLNRLYPYLQTMDMIYGDSAMFAGREAYEKIGGFRPAYGMFADVDLYRRLRKAGEFIHLPQKVTISQRRFTDRPFFWRMTGWLFLQGLYWIGVPAKTIVKYSTAKK